MYLKRIELEGFKSFADRTVVPVERGLTGVVGPNGCGKSNVVDALLWVMGERSAKALRADAMEDVIFKGAEGRSGAPYAMVEIIIGDELGAVVDQGGEIAVGRRLFRTGESEFLLNGRKVRRKDVRDLLLDTGLGVRGYMLLAQGKIDAVLAANPAERRSVFEEAAGISRYKQRKHETRLKLGHVAQDLARVDDVLQEVSKVVRSLRYQAGKAQRFMELREGYRRLRVQVALGEETQLREGETGLRGSEKLLEERIAGLRDEREQGESQLEALRREEEALRSRHDQIRAEASAAKERVAALDERVHGLEDRANELEQRRQREKERLAGLDDVVREQDSSCSQLGDELQALLEAREELASQHQEAEACFAAARDLSQEQRRRIEELRRSVLDALQERTARHNDMASAGERRSAAEGGLRAVERRRAEVEAERERLGGEFSGLESVFAEAVQVVERSEGRAGELVAERDGLRSELAEQTAAASEARQRAAEAGTRLETLASVEEERAGLPDHVRDLLSGPPEGMDGLFLEGVRIEAPWDRILENLLGRMQHALWIDSRARAVGLEGGCFDLFFPPESEPSPVHLPAARPLADLIEGDAARCHALVARLGEVYCVDRAKEARALAAEHPGALFLSRDGELHGRGFARVGILRGDAAAGLLARRNAKEAAQKVAREAEESIRTAETSAEGTRARLAELDEQLARMEGELRDAVAGRERAQARLQDVERRRGLLAEESAGLESEHSQLQGAVEAAAAEEAEAATLRDAAEARRNDASTALDQVEVEAAAHEEVHETARGALQDARIALDRHGHRQQHLEERVAESRKTSARSADERGRLEREVEQLDQRLVELREEAGRGREETRGLLGERTALDERVQEAAVQLGRAREALDSLRGRLEGGGDRLEALLGERQELALQLQRVGMQREEIARGLSDEFQQPLDALARSLGVDPALPPFDDAAQLEVAAAELAQLRAKLDSIGAVNVEAVEELEEREERLNFLEKEREDLLKARNNLETTLEELDELCRARFLETFTIVQGHFEGIFRRLFRGGRASVELEDGADPLDAGIEVHVKPPGKELRSINLLSGGERSLTAIALLLAVFRSRPSPFCLLDEVDAALDDANVERFLDVLVDFTRDTQFMVVTHNKLTMGRCERLFGVTMRRPGVSLIVGVDLADIPETHSVADALQGAVPDRTASRGALEPGADRGGAEHPPSRQAVAGG